MCAIPRSKFIVSRRKRLGFSAVCGSSGPIVIFLIDFRSQDILLYGTYCEAESSRIGYFDFYGETGEKELVNIRFFRSTHAQHFFQQLEVALRPLHKDHVVAQFRTALCNYRPFNADDGVDPLSELVECNSIHE